MSKQDRQGARNIPELMGRYNFGKTFAEILGIATDAQDTAQKAAEAVGSLDNSLDHDEIFNRLTKNGALQGLYRGNDGELYVNATYIKSGKISSDIIDGSTLTITKGATIAGWDIDQNSIFKKPFGGTWGSGTFMCTGSNSAYSIGGSGDINGWAFGAGGKFGVTTSGEVYCSALHATDGCRLGEWYISGGVITSAPIEKEGMKDVVWIEPTRVVYMYNQDSGDGIIASWEQIVRAASNYDSLEARVAALEA